MALMDEFLQTINPTDLLPVFELFLPPSTTFIPSIFLSCGHLKPLGWLRQDPARRVDFPIWGLLCGIFI
jgi:hypothetical protein